LIAGYKKFPNSPYAKGMLTKLAAVLDKLDKPTQAAKVRAKLKDRFGSGQD
jgi:TolA-binding protein